MLPERKPVAVFVSSSQNILREYCGDDADILHYRIKGVLPGLTCRRTFDVIRDCSLFCIGKGERFLSAWKLNDEFYFATAGEVYRILVPLRRRTLTLLDRLNAAHFDFNIDWLWWLVLSSGAAFA